MRSSRVSNDGGARDVDARPIRNIRQAIDRMADAASDEIFLISPDAGRSLTYAEFREQCRAIEAALRGAGLQPGDKVALLLDNGLFTVQAFLGTIYAGLVAVPRVHSSSRINTRSSHAAR
jgi:acyl-CoA synthetase (AMP-forming)/AMP-acid ligase II